MAVLLSPAKLVLLAAQLAVRGDIDGLTTLAARHGTVLHKELLLRILLTYLPETLPSIQYVDLIRQLDSGSFPDTPDHDVDCSPVEDLAEDDAAKKVRKLHLLPLTAPEPSGESGPDALSLFFLRRSYRVDEEAGLLDELPALLLPFMHHSPCIRTLLVATILPLLRRNCEFYPHEPIPHTLHAFRQLPDRVAVNLLLSQTGGREANLALVGRDLRGLVGPWLSAETRWRKHGGHTAESSGDPLSSQETGEFCAGWDEVLRWLTTQASRNWKVAVSAIMQWDGPADADFGGWGTAEISDDQRRHLDQSYARAALASAYLIPEASLNALDGAYGIVARVAQLRNLEPLSPLASALAALPPIAEQISDDVVSASNAVRMRNHLLAPSNPMTAPTDASKQFLQALILSAHILTKAGCPCTIRRAGELVLLRDEREQTAEAAKLIHCISNNGPKSDDKFWLKARNEILWLRDWGAEDGWSSEGQPRGIFSQVKRDFLEVELLRALLANTRYALARTIYEDAPDQPLGQQALQDTVYATAMTAYDNASNPNRTRGGLKKCDDIIKAFPKTIPTSNPQTKRVEALLQATHSLSGYRLVFKQGEPFTPVILRVHPDPISIIGKILEQNPKSYTHLHDLLVLGTRMVEAGLTNRDKPPLTPEEETTYRLSAERRITAMCIDAALTEDDFETAYSYVVNRLANATTTTTTTTTASPDDYSWRAALQAGKYRRTTHTLTPHYHHHHHHRSGGVGGGSLSSANPEVRHQEQRIECLATALRVAPAPTLQEIVNAFRRAEEELEVLVREEDEREDEWDARGDDLRGGNIFAHNLTTTTTAKMPGGFAVPGYSPARSSLSAHHNKTSSSAAAAAGRTTTAAATRRGAGGVVAAGDADEDAAPMSLFDLSRASVLSAQRNLSALSGLQRSTAAAAGLGRLAVVGVGGGGDNGNAGGSGGRSSLDMPPLSASGSTASAAGSANGGGGDEAGSNKRVRKRDQLREAAMGTLVSGVGWLVGAPPPPPNTQSERE
ncbi:Sec39-domain-containing protein [Parathielavia hyrcaniae]|uniref:Sec39-domain-containing protein n=1 Tax=Parathielavia hyrcaniae TaxID=113614 RepID=A0AAN6Q5L2_9PEZI|nr:Sec39-domain-containing protein [Parathielavia hyrcaniae]